VTDHITKVFGMAEDARFAGRNCDYIDIGWSDARKHHQLRHSASGRELAIDLSRGTFLAAGTVLWDDGTDIVVVRRPPEDAIVVNFQENEGANGVRRALLLGYALGNQHTHLEISRTSLRTPLMTEPGVARQMLASLGLKGTVTQVPLAEHGWTNTSADHHHQLSSSGHSAAAVISVDSSSTGLLGLLSLLQISDSAFPSGRIVHSNGVEAWLACHETARKAEILEMMHCYLAESYAPLDAAAIGHAWRLTNSRELLALDQLITAYKIADYARTASESCGRQLARLAQQALLTKDEVPFMAEVAARATSGNLCVVEGTLSRALGIGLNDSVLSGIRSAFAGMLSVAVRLGRVGPLWAQEMLHEGRPRLIGLARLAVETRVGDLRSACPELEIHAMRRQANRTNLFAS
jgi:urease accessory protein UreF/urease accessory protein UreE